MTFGQHLDTREASYYSNLTGFWHGELHSHNLTTAYAAEHPDGEDDLTKPYTIPANMSELAQELGEWNWMRSNKISLSLGDKSVPLPHQTSDGSAENVAMIQVGLLQRCAMFCSQTPGSHRANWSSRTLRAQTT